MFSARTIVSIAISLALAAGAGAAVNPEAGAKIKAAARQVTAEVDAASRAALSTMIDSEAGVGADTSGQVETGTHGSAEADAHVGSGAEVNAEEDLDVLPDLNLDFWSATNANGEFGLSIR